MGFTNDRYEHLVVIIRDEIHAEHAREATMLEVRRRRMSEQNTRVVHVVGTTHTSTPPPPSSC